jgi:hypothetical protein
VRNTGGKVAGTVRSFLTLPVLSIEAGSNRRMWAASLGHRAVFDAAGHDQGLALLQPHVPVPELPAEAALHDEEQLVLVAVVVPDKRPLKPDQLHLRAGQFAHDLGLPRLGEAGELVAGLTFSIPVAPWRWLSW